MKELQIGDNVRFIKHPGLTGRVVAVDEVVLPVYYLIEIDKYHDQFHSYEVACKIYSYLINLESLHPGKYYSWWGPHEILKTLSPLDLLIESINEELR